MPCAHVMKTSSMYLCIYIYIYHISMYLYIYKKCTCAHTYVHTHIYIYIHTYIYMCVYVRMYVFAKIHASTHRCTLIIFIAWIWLSMFLHNRSAIRYRFFFWPICIYTNAYLMTRCIFAYMHIEMCMYILACDMFVQN